MIASGLMTAAGRAVFDVAMQENRTVPSLRSYSVPDELEAALAESPRAAENFRNMTMTHRGMYVAWVSSAKRPETRRARAERSIVFLEENKRLLDVFGIKKRP